MSYFLPHLTNGIYITYVFCLSWFYWLFEYLILLVFRLASRSSHLIWRRSCSRYSIWARLGLYLFTLYLNVGRYVIVISKYLYLFQLLGSYLYENRWNFIWNCRKSKELCCYLFGNILYIYFFFERKKSKEKIININSFLIF